MKKMLVAVVLCVMMAGFVFAATPDSAVDVSLTISKYVELVPDATQTVAWSWTDPLNYDLGPKTINLTAYFNCDANISVDATSKPLGTVNVSHDFSGIASTGATGVPLPIPVIFSNDFDTTNWWTETAFTGTVSFTFTIAAN